MNIDVRRAAQPALIFLSLSLIGPAIAAESPYPRSELITGVDWDFSQTVAKRVAQGSDIWPITWGADDDLYTAWGDGGGFTGTDSRGRVSIGFGKIADIPSASSDATFAGQNIWGAAPEYAITQATFGGKIQSMLSVQRVLYAYGGIWTHANCKCADPTRLEGDGPKDGRALGWSKDLGKTWALAHWRSGDNVYFLNFGKDNWEARDAYVYEYFLRPGDSAHLYLRRVLPRKLTAAPAKSREFLAATDASGEHVRWSKHEKDAVAVFVDPANVALPQVTYNAALGRFLLTVGHNPGGKHATLSAGQLGFFEAPNPWGPWATIDYEDDWGRFGSRATGAYLGLHIPSKWISADGKTFWAVFSNLHEFDSFNVVKAALRVGDGAPQLAAPTIGTFLAPGQDYSASGAAFDDWMVELHSKRVYEIGRGCGDSFTFRVPHTAKAGEFVRLTLRSHVASVYRDFAIAVNSSKASHQP